MNHLNSEREHICFEPHRCLDCLDKLIQKNYKYLSDFILDKSLPSEITRITLEIPPIKENLSKYYSLKGIDTIFFNIFKQTNRNVIHDLRNGDVFVRISLRRDDCYTLSKLVFEILFLKKLLSETISSISDTIKTLFVLHTYGKGKVEVISDVSLKKVEEIIRIDYVIGLDTISKTSHKLYSNLSDTQIEELNYFSMFPTIKIKMSDLINNPQMTLFQVEKSVFNWS